MPAPYGCLLKAVTAVLYEPQFLPPSAQGGQYGGGIGSRQDRTTVMGLLGIGMLAVG